MGSATETRPGLPSKPARRGGGDATAAAAATALGAVPPAEGARNGQGFRSFNAGGDSDGNNAGSSASSSTMRPISLDGSEEDAALQGAEYLSRSEVARRRLRRGRQLMKLYKRLYWGLIEEVRVRYRNYYWQYGRSPVEEEESGSEGEGEDNGGFASGTVDGEGMGESGRAGEVGSSRKRDRDRCAFPGCKTKPMALTMYCHPHILSDPRQKLYKPCSFPIKSSHSGPVICGKPILCAPQLSYCPTHIQKAQKNVSQALKRAGLFHNSSRPPPKINVIIAECVRQIQAKRREAQRVLDEEEAADVEDMSGDD